MAGNHTVWIVLQHRDGQLHRGSREAIAAGQRLAAAIGGAAEAVLLGLGTSSLAESAAAFDLARVRHADHPHFTHYTPGGYVGALAPALRAESPAFVVLPHTYQTVDFAASLAQASGAGWLPEVTGIESGEGGLTLRRPILGGKLEAQLRVRGEGPMVVSVQSGAFSADTATAGSAPIEPFPFAAEAATPDREILGVEAVAGEKLDLTKAEIIVAAGRGVGGADRMGPLRELAAALGAEIAASRPVIDNGWLPRDRQIGSSGQTVAPRLYLAAGISGAIQHTVGMKGSQVVVAINKDPGAPIFNLARYGIVGDLHDILPALTKAVREAKGG
ncbi:MAG TPA: electron transfer flavoprotein subunit alpha/FixB family protein [Thermoanaerobaculia bacterium]|nr:electron transfer flavoprotein subunit alpha/FixB family protein [Thermoanaerobaculia bacterium]